MVDMVSDDGKQVPQASLNCFDPFREVRKASAKFGKPLRLEGAVHQDAAAFAQRGTARGNELAPGVARIHGEELVVFGWRRRAR
jgi:hypothetical protein